METSRRMEMALTQNERSKKKKRSAIRDSTQKNLPESHSVGSAAKIDSMLDGAVQLQHPSRLVGPLREVSDRCSTHYFALLG